MAMTKYELEEWAKDLKSRLEWYEGDCESNLATKERVEKEYVYWTNKLNEALKKKNDILKRIAEVQSLIENYEGGGE